MVKSAVRVTVPCASLLGRHAIRADIVPERSEAEQTLEATMDCINLNFTWMKK
jgi:hypothetical protein